MTSWYCGGPAGRRGHGVLPVGLFLCTRISARTASVCWPSAGTAPMAASRPGTVTGGQQRPDRAGRGVHLAPPVPGRELRVGGELGGRAQPGAGDAGLVQQGHHLVGRHGAERGLDDRRQLAVVGDPVRVGGEPLVGDQVRPAAAPARRARPTRGRSAGPGTPARPGRGRTGRWTRAGRRCAGRPARRRRCSSRAGSSTRPARPAGTPRGWIRGRCAPARTARSGRRCRRTSRRRCRRPRCPPCTARPAVPVTESSPASHCTSRS